MYVAKYLNNAEFAIIKLKCIDTIGWSQLIKHLISVIHKDVYMYSIILFKTYTSL